MKDFKFRMQKLYATIYNSKFPIFRLSWRLIHVIDFKFINIKNIEWIEQRIKEVGK